jgi:hypothetical protein
MKIITVTEKHIREGLRGKPDKCPIALAIKEGTGLAYVSVTPWYIRIRESELGPEITISTNMDLQRWIMNYDGENPLIRQGAFQFDWDALERRPQGPVMPQSPAV